MMLHLYQKITVGVTIFTLCTVATISQEQGEKSIKISIVTIPDTIGECSSDDNRQTSLDLLQNATRKVIYQIYGSPLPECGPGKWKRVFYLNASRFDQSCPVQWNLVTSPVRGCAGAGESCRSAFSDSINTTYSKVCGRIIGKGVTSPDAFYRYIENQNTIEGNYLEGVSITHGASGSRTHIWTLGAGHRDRCPCDNSDHNVAPLPPAEVGDNYYCDRADELDLLWTGKNCMNDNPCCSFHNPPYFSVQLSEATTDTIELRICFDQSQGDETVLVLFAEIYVQ